MGTQAQWLPKWYSATRADQQENMAQSCRSSKTHPCLCCHFSYTQCNNETEQEWDDPFVWLPWQCVTQLRPLLWAALLLGCCGLMILKKNNTGVINCHCTALHWPLWGERWSSSEVTEVCCSEYRNSLKRKGFCFLFVYLFFLRGIRLMRWGFIYLFQIPEGLLSF